MLEDWEQFVFFSAIEFDYPERMGERFMQRLDEARAIADVPFFITSDFRTPEENRDIGGAEHSPHLTGRAVDIRVRSNHDRSRILYGLFGAGFTQVGIYTRHIHVHELSDAYHPGWRAWVGISK